MEIKWADGQFYYYDRCFIVVNEKGEAIGGPSSCKDRAGDKISGSVAKRSLRAHGNAYDYATMPVTDLEATRIVFVGANPNALDLVNQVENHFGIPRSTTEEVTNKPQQASGYSPLYGTDRLTLTYWQGNKLWVLAPPLHGFWCVLIRSGVHHVIGRDWRETLSAMGTREIMKVILPAIEFIFHEGPENVFGNDPAANWMNDKVEYGHLHGNKGPYSYAIGSSNQYFSHWKRFKVIA